MEDFKDYYPCEGQEFTSTMYQLTHCDYYEQLATMLFPEETPDSLRAKIMALKDVDEFQAFVMYRACEFIIHNTMSQFTFSGFEQLGDKPCIFVSNHRDITVDAILTEYVHISQGLKSSHVVIGSNLFEMPLMKLLAKANKMFAIGRGGNPREFYNSLITMSRYLHHIVGEKHERVWIAQRNGRTKDGHDRTDPAVIKMIASYGDRRKPLEALAQMNIVPVSISYEWEPCGVLKARETTLKRQGPYQKVPGEDTQSIISGIKDHKGHVHLAFCKPITPAELAETNGDFDAIAAILDKRIAENYQLHPNNHIARDMQLGISESAHYTSENRTRFEAYLTEATSKVPVEGLRETLVEMYAAPLM